jgi:hypothetical protein
VKVHRGSLTRQQRDVLLHLNAAADMHTVVPRGSAGRPFHALHDAGLITIRAWYAEVPLAKITPAGRALANEILSHPDARKQPR